MTLMIHVTKEELLGLHDKLTVMALDLMRKKNQDYTGGTEDPFANFRGSLAMGVEPEIGLMIRMTDKLQRAKSFVANGTLAVAEEGILDIGADLINYSVLLMGLLLERQLGAMDEATAVSEPLHVVPAAEPDGGFDLTDKEADPKTLAKPAAPKGGSKK